MGAERELALGSALAALLVGIGGMSLVSAGTAIVFWLCVIWALRRKIANMDEAEVLNLILDKLRNTPTNRDFLATIKVG